MVKPGDAVTPNEFPRVDRLGNPGGKGAVAYDDSFKILGFVMPGFPMLVLEVPGSIYVKVLGPVGPVWMQVGDLKQL